MRLFLPILVVLCSAALAATSSQTLEQVLGRLPKSLEWQSVDLTFLSAQRSLESAQAAAGIRISIGADANINSNLSTGANTSGYKVNASASLPVLPWASQFDELRKAERAFERARLDWRDSRNILVINTSTQYLNLRLAQTDLEVAKSTVLLRDSQAKSALQQRSNNQITADQYASTMQNLETAKNNLLQAENTLELAQLTLANTLGTDDEILALSSAPLPANLNPDLAALLKPALEQRSDVQKAWYALRDAEDNLAIAQRDRWLPATTVNVGVSDSGASLTAGLNLQTGSLSVGGSYQPPTTPTSGTTISISGSISLPVVAPSSDARIKSAETALNTAKQNFERSKKSAELDLKQKYLDAQSSVRKIAISQKALENAKNTLNSSQSRLNIGSITKADFENAKLSVQQAERDLESTVIAAYLAWLRLENAVGKGLIKI